MWIFAHRKWPLFLMMLAALCAAVSFMVSAELGLFGFSPRMHSATDGAIRSLYGWTTSDWIHFDSEEIHSEPTDSVERPRLANKEAVMSGKFSMSSGYHDPACSHIAVDETGLMKALLELTPKSVNAVDIRKKAHIPEGDRYFIAMLVHNNAEILPNMIGEAIKLAMLLQRLPGDFSNVFVSIYESGSSDFSAILLKAVSRDLEKLGMPHRLVIGGETRKPMEHRIKQLSHLRNAVLAPLFESDSNFDHVIFLNDVITCASSIVELVYHQHFHESEMACGVDFIIGSGHTLEYYDTWVAIDMQGNHFTNGHPYIKDTEASASFERMEPFQVFSCWGGAAVLRASMFHDERLRFRSGGHLECSTSECEILPRDLWASGRGRILTVPTVVTAYDFASYGKVLKEMKRRYPSPTQSGSRSVPKLTFNPNPPRIVSCCFIDSPTEHYVDYTQCPRQPWEWWYHMFGIPRALTATAVDPEKPSMEASSKVTLDAIRHKMTDRSECGSPQKRLIPSEIFFTWKTDVLTRIPHLFFLNMLMWIWYHPCYKISILSDHAAAELIKQKSPEYWSDFSSIREPGQKAPICQHSCLLT